MLGLISKRMSLTLASGVLCFVFFIPTTSWADGFTVDIAPSIPWITFSRISLDHDAGGNVFFSGLSIWRTENETGTLPLLDGNLVYNASPFNSITSVGIRDNADLAGSITSSNSDLTVTGTIVNFSIFAAERRNFFRPNPIISEFVNQSDTTTNFTHQPAMNAVPEPTSLLLFGSGLLGLAGYRWSQRRRERTQVA